MFMKARPPDYRFSFRRQQSGGFAVILRIFLLGIPFPVMVKSGLGMIFAVLAAIV